MHFLKCNNCGHLNEVKSEYMVFCSKCKKKLGNNFSDWHRMHPEKSFEDFKHLVCISHEEIPVSNQPVKSKKPKGILYAIGSALIIAIFYAAGHFGGVKFAGLFKPGFDQAMMEIASDLNKSCPIMIDNATRFDNAVALPDKVFQYNYTIVSAVKDSINIEYLKNYIEPRILNTVKTQPEMKFLREHKTTFNYSYKDKDGVFLFMISVKPEQYE